VHPFAPIAQTPHAVGRAGLVPAPMAPCDRVVRADKFRTVRTPRCEVGGKHVLVLDDVWTTGSDAQSAALALRRAGAAAVSVMVMDRWLNPRYRTTAEFIDTRLHREYDPDICSVTGGRCP
jgi:phosphoribosylpyrophosphate synthetase